MIRNKCVYCKKENKLTKEHVFPTFISKMVPKMMTKQQNVPYYFIAEPQIKDVCQNCNNKKLAQLDEYAKILTQKYFVNIIRDTIEFEYDYNKLLRWLLKVIYNGSRAFGTSYAEFENYIPYILDDAQQCPETLLYIHVMKPSFYENKIIEPKTIGISDVIIPNIQDIIILKKGFYFYSYFFIIIGLKEKPHLMVRSEIDNIIQKSWGSKLIEKKLGKISIDASKSEMDYLNHLYYQQLINPTTISENTKRQIPNLREFHFKKH